MWEVEGGVEFEVIAKPRASREGIMGVHDGALKVSVTAAAEKGGANAAIVKLLSRALHSPRSRITILRGRTSRRKRIRAEGVAPDQLSALTEEASK